MMKDVQLQNPPGKGYTGLSNFFLKLEIIRFSFHTLSLLAHSILFLSFFSYRENVHWQNASSCLTLSELPFVLIIRVIKLFPLFHHFLVPVSCLDW